MSTRTELAKAWHKRKRPTVSNSRSTVKLPPMGAATPAMSQSTSRLVDPARRSRLLQKLEREEKQGQRSKLAGILTQRLAQKHRAKKGGELHAVIDGAVSAFAAQKASLSAPEFRQLEQQVEALVARAKEQRRMRRTAPAASAAAPAPAAAAPSAQHALRAARAQTPNTPDLPLNWVVFDALTTVQLEQKERSDAAVKSNRTRKMKTELDAQLASNRETQREREAYVAAQRQKFAQYEESEAAAAAKRQAKHDDEKRVRREQIEALEARRVVQRDAKRAEEASELARCKRELQQDKDKAARKVEVERTRLAQILVENEAHKKKRTELRQLEADEEQKSIVQCVPRACHARRVAPNSHPPPPPPHPRYRAKLDREEANRSSAFKDRQSRLEAAGKRFMTEGAGRVAADLEAKDAARVAREQHRKAEADTARERAKRDALKASQAGMVASNRALVQDREARKVRARAEKRAAAAALRAQADKYAAADDDKAARRKRAYADHKRALAEQIARGRAGGVGGAPARGAELSEAELSLNKDLIRALRSDKKVAKQVQSVLHRVPGEGGGFLQPLHPAC